MTCDKHAEYADKYASKIHQKSQKREIWINNNLYLLSIKVVLSVFPNEVFHLNFAVDFCKDSGSPHS